MNSLVPTDNLEHFIVFMGNREKKDLTQAPRPASVKMNGNTGRYSMSVWNKDEKKFDVKELGEGLIGTVLDETAFAKSKYEDGAREYWRTREFSSQKEPVELLHINNDAKDAKDKTKVVASYPSYHDFKLNNTSINPTTKKETYGFDYWVSLYVYIHEMDQVVNIQMKGSSRGAWFDYKKSYAGNTGAQALVQVKIQFASDKNPPVTKKVVEEGDKTTFHASFTTLGLNSHEELMKVASTTQALFQWKAAWEAQNGHVDEEPIKVVATPEPHYSPELQAKVDTMNEIKLEDLPF